MKRSIGTRQEIVNGNSNIAIIAKDIHKSFRLPTEQAFGLKQAIFNRLRGIKGYKEQKVLKGLDFEIKKGEFMNTVNSDFIAVGEMSDEIAELFTTFLQIVAVLVILG